MFISKKDNPLDLFSEWMEKAQAEEGLEPNAAALATADSDGRPSVRMVLVKSWDEDGFVFYTNLGSRKAGDIRANPHAALCLYWNGRRRQIRIEGAVETVTDAVADAYFATRDRGSQIGAWASIQSAPMAGRFSLEREVAKYTAKFGIAKIPRPPHWSGYQIVPSMIEFWAYGEFRLHSRLVYYRESDGWRTERLFP